MKPDDLPVVGPIENPHHLLLERFDHHFQVKGKHILCIGLSEAEIDGYLGHLGASKIEVLTNWSDHLDADSKKYRTVVGDVTRKLAFLTSVLMQS